MFSGSWQRSHWLFRVQQSRLAFSPYFFSSTSAVGKLHTSSRVQFGAGLLRTREWPLSLRDIRNLLKGTTSIASLLPVKILVFSRVKLYSSKTNRHVFHLLYLKLMQEGAWFLQKIQRFSPKMLLRVVGTFRIWDVRVCLCACMCKCLEWKEDWQKSCLLFFVKYPEIRGISLLPTFSLLCP